MMLEAYLLLAAALFAVGLFGALSQQSVVMVMMGLELMVNAVIVAAAALWFHTSPERPDGQVLVLVAVTAMAVEMAMGFAVTTAIFRARDVDMVDMAADLADHSGSGDHGDHGQHGDHGDHGDHESHNHHGHHGDGGDR
ncbi:NAD(P)H-quinone oxidoreductase subunit 4L [Nocardiopsis arvandica]|uniref:NADH-quinone oxidoreductase subunit K n=1 Tax=Nocardiopsis sinuspersici TaxID=501010 RepID=A0A7Z0BLS8_9ACTN|nr:NADH-quinone oxidoreductase subunit NuoK [Nocardiopsis sinuspersici]NYH54525.1 NAD(P)H-quinone oxidoreductase subunit 4L [Nocardiopsis sinuspersici]